MCKALGVLLLALFVRLAHSWDFALTVENRLEFYTNDGDKKSTVHLNSRNLTSIIYNEVDNLLLYVDKQSGNDAICAYNITSSMEYKCYIERSGRNIQDLAFDPVTEVLFFTDTKERSINSFSLKPGSKNNVNGNLLIKIDYGIPTLIVVDSCRGYVYWITTNRTPSTIERSRLNGLEREVVINAKWNFDLRGLAIDHQAQKLYWKMYDTSSTGFIYSADLDGNNKESNGGLRNVPGLLAINDHNSLSVSKQFFLSVSRCSPCTQRYVYRFPKPLNAYIFNKIITVDTTRTVAIATNDKIKDQFKGISECNQVLDDYETNNLLKKIAKEYYVGPFCVHGTKWTLNRQSFCKCTPGYTGKRCEGSVCENSYCFQGNCSITEEGLPICRCNAGYSGKRCEVSMCHGYCSNNGSCSLNEKSEPICQCKGDNVGTRCEISDCLNYCLSGNCSFNEEGLPECRCHTGYSGERCEINVCHQYCLNNGICSLNEEDEPVCECTGEYHGERCDVPLSLNNDVGSLNVGVEPACQCDGTHDSSRLQAGTKNTISTNSNYYSAAGNLTLADLLANWQKPVATINVFVEVKPNN